MRGVKALLGDTAEENKSSHPQLNFALSSPTVDGLLHVVNLYRSHMLQADSEEMLQAWVAALQLVSPPIHKISIMSTFILNVPSDSIKCIDNFNDKDAEILK